MRTPKEVLQDEIDEMNAEYYRVLKVSYEGNPGKDQVYKLKWQAEKTTTLAKINARINEFNNAISKLL